MLGVAEVSPFSLLADLFDTGVVVELRLEKASCGAMFWWSWRWAYDTICL